MAKNLCSVPHDGAACHLRTTEPVKRAIAAKIVMQCIDFNSFFQPKAFMVHPAEDYWTGRKSSIFGLSKWALGSWPCMELEFLSILFLPLLYRSPPKSVSGFLAL
eukprot:scaffold22642_cov134-Cylindrotheca_fusiformis.AAC.39